MAQLPFIAAAYGLTVVAVGIMLVANWNRMRRAERRLEDER